MSFQKKKPTAKDTKLEQIAKILQDELNNTIICNEDQKKGADPMNIVSKLETYRLEKRVTQEALADKLGVAFSTVNRWFNR